MPIDPGDIATWTGSAVALGAGITGLVIGVRGQSAAKKANELAENANSIAAEAASSAAEANRIAHDANQLSENANAIAKRQAEQGTEGWFTEWDPQWESEGAVLVLKNVGCDAGLQTSVVVTTGEIHHLHPTPEDVALGKELRVPLPEIAEQRKKKQLENVVRADRMGARNIASVGARYKAELKVLVTWETGLGFPQSAKLEITVR